MKELNLETKQQESTFKPTYELIGELKPSKRYGGTFPIKSFKVELVPEVGTLTRFSVLGMISRGKYAGKYSFCKKLNLPETVEVTEGTENEDTELSELEADPVFAEVPQCILAETTDTNAENPFQVVHLTGDFPTSDLVWDKSFTEEEIKTALRIHNIYLND